jgi:Methyltransferase domain
VRVASVNLNKRIGSTAARSRLTHWLTRNEIVLLLAQEPWRPPNRAPVQLDGFRAVGGNDKVFAWIHEGLETPTCLQPAAHRQRIELGYLAVHNTYLDAYSQATRAAQLKDLHACMRAERDQPTLAVGDFNLAPRPQDGLADGDPSTFNSRTDREPFRALLAACLLHDATATNPPEFSVARSLRGKQLEFRCDLALVSDYLAPSVTVAYDHNVRTDPATAFTDHSALLIDLPISPPLARQPDPGRLFSLIDDGKHNAKEATPSALAELHAHKTAMTRRGPSPAARTVLELLAPKLLIRSILDYGCGRGSDVAHYRQVGLAAEGYDPHPAFGWARQPAGRYDLITLVFVLNVIPDPWQRVQAVKQAAEHLRQGGHMLIVTRTPKDIETRAARAGWTRHNDGYWSSNRKKTFQRGISEVEIERLARRAKLSVAAEQSLLPPIPSACQVLLTSTPA